MEIAAATIIDLAKKDDARESCTREVSASERDAILCKCTRLEKAEPRLSRRGFFSFALLLSRFAIFAKFSTAKKSAVLDARVAYESRDKRRNNLNCSEEIIYHVSSRVKFDDDHCFLHTQEIYLLKL